MGFKPLSPSHSPVPPPSPTFLIASLSPCPLSLPQLLPPPFNYLPALDNFLVDVTEANFWEKEFIYFSLQSQGMQPIKVGKIWWQESQAAGHVLPQEADGACWGSAGFFFIFSQGMALPALRIHLPIPVNPSRNSHRHAQK